MDFWFTIVSGTPDYFGKAQLMLSLTLEIPEYTDESFSEEIIAAAGRKIVEYAQKRIDSAINERVAEVASEIIATRIGDVIDQILRDGFRETDNYGSPRGQIKTVKTMVLEALSPSNNGSYGRKTLPAIVNEVLVKRFDEEIADGTKRLRAVVDETIKGKVAEALASAFGVKA